MAVYCWGMTVSLHQQVDKYTYGIDVCRCAYLVGNVQEYATVCLELIGKCILYEWYFMLIKRLCFLNKLFTVILCLFMFPFVFTIYGLFFCFCLIKFSCVIRFCFKF